MSSVEELAASIEEYNKELTDVSLSLQSPNLSASDKEQLQELQQNLLQLLELSLDQLQRLQSNEEHEDTLDDEMALFKAEIASLDAPSEATVESTSADISSSLPTDDNTLDVRTLLLSNTDPFVKVWSREGVSVLEGEPVRAPFTEGWGGHTYHNAVVMSVTYDEQCPMAAVLFSQPTSLAMLPCRFYLSDTCNFGAECQFSHGYEVSVTDLRVYEEPKRVREKSHVLCKHTDSSGKRRKEAALLWHNGTVECVLPHSASVNCLDCKEVVECALDNIVTTWHEDSCSPEGSISDLTSVPEPIEEVEEASPQPMMLGGGKNKDFGHWEKYTKGIGSLLMQKMGYTPGSGLGKDGEGRIEPVPAYLYPVGVSVDRCMELRERSGGENMLQVEKRMLRDQKKEEKRQQREEEELSKNSVFDIINNKLSDKGRTSRNEGGKKKVIGVGRSHLSEDSTKTLNMKSYQLHSQGRQLEREIEKLEASMERQSKDKGALEGLREKLRGKREQLGVVRGAEKRVDGEQQARKDAKKYAVF